MFRALLARVLIAMSVICLGLAVAMAFGLAFSFRVAGIRLRGADEMGPLIVGAVAASCAVFVSPGRTARLLALATGALVCLEIVALTFVRASPQQFSVGDGAFLELYTLHALRGVWPLGPYSQFGWNHPGPLYFYALAPLYAAGGLRYVGLNTGAAIINLTCLVLLLGLVGRYGGRALAVWIPIALGVYMFKLAPVFVSAWNPHVLALSTGALVTVSAALAAGHLWLAPVSIIVGSFCAQTHVGLAPCVLALWAYAAIAVAMRIRRGDIQVQTARRWLNFSLWTMVVCWLLPVAEELNNRPGNLKQILRFFLMSDAQRPFADAFAIWADVMSGLVTNSLKIPYGHALPTAPSWGSIALTTGQLVGLIGLVVRSRRVDQPFEHALGVAGLVSAVVALWSVSRITVPVGDYHVFWMSVMGSLNWAVVAAGVTSRLVDRLLQVPPRRLAVVTYPLLVVCVTYLPVQTLVMSQRHAASASPVARQIKASADAIMADMSTNAFRRAVVRSGLGAWGVHGGVVVELYKRGAPIAVGRESVSLFGKPLVAKGDEQAEYFVHRSRDYVPARDGACAEVVLRRRYLTVTRRTYDDPGLPSPANATRDPCHARHPAREPPPLSTDQPMRDPPAQ